MKFRNIILTFDKIKIPLKLFPEVFTPNLTTKILIDAILDHSKKKKKFFNKAVDLGCGCGAIGVSLKKLGIIKNKFYMSDISKKAVFNSKYNLNKNKLIGDVRTGSMFKPWSTHKFDLIINDISAISSDLARISPWFKKIPCRSGRDGTKLSIDFLKQVPKFSMKNANIIFPVLSLSNEKKIITFAKEKFKNIKLLKSVSWPLPDEIQKQKKKLDVLRKKNFISFTKICEKIICKTSVYLIKI